MALQGKETLAGSLKEAEAEHRPYVEQASQAEHLMNQAVAEHRFDDAAEHKRELDVARQNEAITGAKVTALRGAIQTIAAREEAEQAELGRQRHKAEARIRVDVETANEAEAAEQVEQHLAEAKAGLAAVRQALHRAAAAEELQGLARQARHDALVIVENWEPQAVARPNRVRVMTDGSDVMTRVFADIFHGRHGS